MSRIFVTGIGTDVGKTVASAIICQALDAEYWKPIQAGDLENSDSNKVHRWLQRQNEIWHKPSYELLSPMSPHAAAKIDGVEIELNKIIPPNTSSHLVIEGAGGLLVPLNDKDCIVDLIKPEYKVVLVARHYLGSINHTLLSAQLLKQRGIEVLGLLYIGDENVETERIIEKQSGLNVIGRIRMTEKVDSDFIKEQAEIIQSNLNVLLNG